MTPAQTMADVTLRATEQTAKSYAYGMRDCANDLFQDLLVLKQLVSDLSEENKKSIATNLTQTIEVAQRCEKLLGDNRLQRIPKSASIEVLE